MPTLAQAHYPDETYIYLQVSEDVVTGHFDIPLLDLDRIYGLDADADGEISFDELAARYAEIAPDFQRSLTFLNTPDQAPISMMELAPETTMFADRAHLRFATSYAAPLPEDLLVRYDGTLSQALPGHRVMLLLQSNYRTGLLDNEAQISVFFGEGEEEQTVSLDGLSGLETFALFVKHGFYHILIGFDHIAFLIALLLPSVLVARGGQWVAVDSFREGLFNILKIVTVFTIAHSITLSLAALNIVNIPERPVEILIALSIIAAAVANLFYVGTRWMIAVMFGLGLLHGLGFANVLMPLGVARATLLQSLVGFNIGVELGQILIVAIVFPILLLLSRSRHYVRYVLQGGSIILIVIAVYWFGERAFVFVGRLFA